MTNLTKKEIEQTEKTILNAVVEEINNQGTTFNFIKRIYNDYEKINLNQLIT